jgi:hypothetical protein
MSMLGYSAANVGEREIRSGYDAFLGWSADADFPLLSANIVRSDTKAPVFLPHLVLEVPRGEGGAGLRIGLIGVARFNPIFRKPGPGGTHLEIIHPIEAVQKEMAKLREKKVDLVILLAALHRDDARRIVAAVDGIDFIVGSYGGVFMTEKETDRESWILYSGNQGKQIGETRIFLRDGEGGPDPVNVLHYLSNSYPVDPEMARYVNSVSLDPTGRSSGGVAKTKGPYVGSESCGKCHIVPTRQWSTTAHARALGTLKQKGKRVKPQCLQCHTTGAGKEGGFQSELATPHLVNVGCESCHGPGRAHLENPGKRYGAIGPPTCTGCHDVENSPEFDFYSYVGRVAHGRGVGR